METPRADAAPPAVPWRLVGLGFALLLLLVTFRNVEGARASERAAAVGFALPLILLPSAVGTVLDVTGWRLLVPDVERRPPWLALARVRLSADAVLLGLPFGSLISEGATPALLGRLCGMSLPDAMAALAARRCLLSLGHGIYIAAGAAAGLLLLRGNGGEEVPWLRRGLLAVAFLVFGLALAAIILLRRGRAGANVLDLLRRVSSSRLRAWLERNAAAFHATDERLGRVLGPGRSIALPLLAYLGSWSAEAAEAALLFALLHSGLGGLRVFSLESGLSIVRALATFAPAGLGAQDFGYAHALARTGVADPLTLAAAFALLRRGKEACWIGIGALAAPGSARDARRPAARRPPRAVPAGQA